MNQNILNSKKDILNYKKRTYHLLKKQKKIDSEIFDLNYNFEKKNRHFNYEIANLQTNLFTIKKDLKKLKDKITNILITLQLFAKKEQVERLKKLNDNISLSKYITANELQKIIDLRIK